MNNYHPAVYGYTPGEVLGVSPGGTVLRHALPSDVRGVDALRKADSGSLGFINIGNYESVTTKTRVHNRDRWKSQHLLVTTDNDDLTGFAYVSYFQPAYTEIIQICVRRDARRMERALLMEQYVEQVSRQIDKPMLRARVAYDIDAVFFWSVIGFQVSGMELSTQYNRRTSQAKRPLFIFTRSLNGMAVPILTLPEQPEFKSAVLRLGEIAA